MFISESTRRRRLAFATVVLLQVALLCVSLLGPAFVWAADPSPDPTAAPTSDPTAEPTPDPTAAPESATVPFIVTFASGVDAATQDSILAGAGATETDA